MASTAHAGILFCEYRVLCIGLCSWDVSAGCRMNSAEGVHVHAFFNPFM